MANLNKKLSFYESIYRYLLLKIGIGVYRVFLNQTPSGDVVGHLKGVVVPPKSGNGRQPIEKITDCCVFTSWFDLLAYIYLQKVGNNDICQSSYPCDYIVISPTQSLVQPYERLKRYENVYGYLELSTEGVVLSSCLKDLLEDIYSDESSIYAPWGSVINHVISTYKLIEI